MIVYWAREIAVNIITLRIMPTDKIKLKGFNKASSEDIIMKKLAAMNLVYVCYLLPI